MIKILDNLYTSNTRRGVRPTRELGTQRKGGKFPGGSFWDFIHLRLGSGEAENRAKAINADRTGMKQGIVTSKTSKVEYEIVTARSTDMFDNLGEIYHLFEKWKLLTDAMWDGYFE